MKIERVSPLTGKTNVMELDVTEQQFELWRGGMYIQDAFPNLDADQREFIKTGYTKEDWDSMFGEEEDE